MASNAKRAATLVHALGAMVRGDSGMIAELYTDDVSGWAPLLNVSSAAELAVELEDRASVFSDVELDVSPLDVGGECACVEWVAQMTHSGPLVVDDDVVIHPSGQRITIIGVTVAEFDGDRIRSFRQYWDDAAVLEQMTLVLADGED